MEPPSAVVGLTQDPTVLDRQWSSNLPSIVGLPFAIVRYASPQPCGATCSQLWMDTVVIN